LTQDSHRSPRHDPTDYAVATSAPTGADGVDYFCASHTYVIVCVMPYGDKIYVADLKKDNYAAVAAYVRGARYNSGNLVDRGLSRELTT
jgi:hypothetical protein